MPSTRIGNPNARACCVLDRIPPGIVGVAAGAGPVPLSSFLGFRGSPRSRTSPTSAGVIPALSIGIIGGLSRLRDICFLGGRLIAPSAAV